MPSTVPTSGSSVIGAPISRIDGPVKTSGNARYASDYNFPGMVYAVPVTSTIANGKILSIDTAAAERLPGVLSIYHYGNFDAPFRIAPGEQGSRPSEPRHPILESETPSRRNRRRD